MEEHPKWGHPNGSDHPRIVRVDGEPHYKDGSGQIGMRGGAGMLPYSFLSFCSFVLNNGGTETQSEIGSTSLRVSVTLRLVFFLAHPLTPRHHFP